MDKISIRIITPEGVKYSKEIRSLNVKTTSGEITILPHHLPLISNVLSCLVVLDDLKDIDVCFISNGVLKVSDNEIILLVSSFNKKEDIDIERAKNSKKRAEDRLNSDDPNIDKVRARDALLRAELRIKLALRGK